MTGRGNSPSASSKSGYQQPESSKPGGKPSGRGFCGKKDHKRSYPSFTEKREFHGGVRGEHTMKGPRPTLIKMPFEADGSLKIRDPCAISYIPKGEYADVVLDKAEPDQVNWRSHYKPQKNEVHAQMGSVEATPEGIQALKKSIENIIQTADPEHLVWTVTPMSKISHEHAKASLRKLASGVDARQPTAFHSDNRNKRQKRHGQTHSQEKQQEPSQAQEQAEKPQAVQRWLDKHPQEKARQTGPCAGCGQSKHQLSRCPRLDPSGTSFAYRGCPVCNTLEHEVDDCPKVEVQRITKEDGSSHFERIPDQTAVTEEDVIKVRGAEHAMLAEKVYKSTDHTEPGPLPRQEAANLIKAPPQDLSLLTKEQRRKVFLEKFKRANPGFPGL